MFNIGTSKQLMKNKNKYFFYFCGKQDLKRLTKPALDTIGTNQAVATRTNS